MNTFRASQLAFVCAAMLVSAAASSQSFSHNGNSTGQSTVPAWPNSPAATATITQSTSTAITAANSVSCNGGSPGFFHTDNSYYRAFTLSTFPALNDIKFRVDNVALGVETANDGGGTGQTVTVRLYKSTTNPPTNASLTLLSTDTVNMQDSATATVFTVNMATTPVLTVATDILVVEVFTPDGSAASNSFFIGSNSAGQSGPSFIKAADCGISEITDLAGIGFANMHVVMSVTGNTQPTPVGLQGFTIE